MTIKVYLPDGTCDNAKITTESGHQIDYVTSLTLSLSPHKLVKAHMELCSVALDLLITETEVDNIVPINETLKHIGYKIVPLGVDV